MTKYLRSLAGIGAASVVGLCLMAASATAQVVDRSKDRADTVKIGVSGEVNMDAVYRSSELTFFTRSFTNPTLQTPPVVPPTGSDGETTYEGHVAIRFAAEMSDKISAVVEFGTRRVDSSAINSFGGNGDNAPALTVREAHVMINDLLMADLAMQLGITTWQFDPTGRGESLAFGMRRSQTITRNIDSDAGAFIDITSEYAGAVRLQQAAFPDELDPVGGVLTWKRDRVQLDIVLLPAVLEGGNAAADEALYAVDLMYKFDDKGSTFGAIAALHAVDRNPTLVPAGTGLNTETMFYTIGAGGALKGLADGATLWGEVYGQFGDAGQVIVAGQEETIEMGGYAFQLGGQYALPNNANNIWFGISYTYLSGDGDAAADADDTVDRFAGYDGNNDTLIMESMYYGYDVDSNYTALKVSGGFSLDFGGRQKNLHVSVMYAHFEATEDIQFAAGGEDALGDEVDVKVRWELNKQAALSTMVGFLMGSDILEESMGGSANDDAEDGAFLWTFGADLRI